MKSFHISRSRIILILTLVLFSLRSEGQSLRNLNHMDGPMIDTYFSDGSAEQARSMAALCDSVIRFYASIIDFQPSVTLLVLSTSDWSDYTGFPVYGMPHILEGQRLIVASEDNDFWRSFIPPLDKLPSDLAQEVTSTYTDDGKNITMRSFFDLLAIHELGHAYHLQAELNMQRKWMEELFANMFLHTYIAERHSELLSALTVFPRMVVSTTDVSTLPYTTLNELEANYSAITQQFPQNYGWYQCRLHRAAGKIYDRAGISAFRKLWYTLKHQDAHLDDAAFAALLSKEVDVELADVLLKWDE